MNLCFYCNIYHSIFVCLYGEDYSTTMTTFVLMYHEVSKN